MTKAVFELRTCWFKTYVCGFWEVFRSFLLRGLRLGVSMKVTQVIRKAADPWSP